MIVLELFSGEGDRLGQCFGCNTANLFVSLFVLLLAHNTKIQESKRVVENNLLLSSPGSCLLPALASSGVASEAEAFAGYMCCAIWLSLDLILASSSVLILSTLHARDRVWSCILVLL